MSRLKNKKKNDQPSRKKNLWVLYKLVCIRIIILFQRQKWNLYLIQKKIINVFRLNYRATPYLALLAQSNIIIGPKKFKLQKFHLCGQRNKQNKYKNFWLFYVAKNSHSARRTPGFAPIRYLKIWFFLKLLSTKKH